MKRKTEFGYLYAQLDRAIKNTTYVREAQERLNKQIAQIWSRLVILENQAETISGSTKSKSTSKKD